MKISKSNVTETLNPSDRMKSIEEKLLSLDEKWKSEVRMGIEKPFSATACPCPPITFDYFSKLSIRKQCLGFLCR